jgi:hypothetical protein
MTMEQMKGRTERDDELQALDRLVGTWELSGHARHPRVRVDGAGPLPDPAPGHRARGEPDEGHRVDRPPEAVRRRGAGRGHRLAVLDDQGNTFDYLYELEGDQLTIWAESVARRRTTAARSARATGRSPASGFPRAAATRPLQRVAHSRRNSDRVAEDRDPVRAQSCRYWGSPSTSSSTRLLPPLQSGVFLAFA